MDGFQVVVRFPIHWGDMDALGHVNNARYFSWFETARIEYFRRVGMSAGGPRDVGPILATTACDFLTPLAYPGDVVACARATRLGSKSFTMEYVIALEGEPAVPCAKGSGVIVMYDYGAKRTVSIPEDLRARITALDGASLAAANEGGGGAR